jgi:hypothetical protein
MCIPAAGNPNHCPECTSLPAAVLSQPVQYVQMDDQTVGRRTGTAVRCFPSTLFIIIILLLLFCFRMEQRFPKFFLPQRLFLSSVFYF